MKLIMPFANGFEETEALAVVDILRWAGIDVDMVGVIGMMMTGARGVKVVMDKNLVGTKMSDYDGIVIPGGAAYEHLGKSKIIMDAIRAFDAEGKLVAAICYSPMLLADAGVLDDKKATIYPGMESKIPYPRDDKVVVDRNVITSQGPGTAIPFALSIVKHLLGKEKAEKMRKKIVADEC